LIEQVKGTLGMGVNGRCYEIEVNEVNEGDTLK
jgi:hypothetical protein